MAAEWLRNGCGMAAEWLRQRRRKRSCYLLQLATFSVEKVAERRKLVSMGWVTGAFMRVRKRRRKTFNLQRNAAQSPSAPKGKQRSKLKRYRWKSISKIPTTQWAVSTYNGLCRARSQRSAILKAVSMNTPMKSSGSIAGWRLAV